MKRDFIHAMLALLSIFIMVYLAFEGRLDELYMFAIGSVLGELTTLTATNRFKINLNYKKKVTEDGSE